MNKNPKNVKIHDRQLKNTSYYPISIEKAITVAFSFLRRLPPNFNGAVFKLPLGSYPGFFRWEPRILAPGNAFSLSTFTLPYSHITLFTHLDSTILKSQFKQSVVRHRTEKSSESSEDRSKQETKRENDREMRETEAIYEAEVNGENRDQYTQSLRSGLK